MNHKNNNNEKLIVENSNTQSLTSNDTIVNKTELNSQNKDFNFDETSISLDLTEDLTDTNLENTNNNNNNLIQNIETLDSTLINYNDTFDDISDQCNDGTHPDFPLNLNEQLLQLAEGYADPTPSVCLVGDTQDLSTTESIDISNSEVSLNLKAKSIDKISSTVNSVLANKSKSVKRLGKDYKKSNMSIRSKKIEQYSEYSNASSKRLPAWMQESHMDRGDYSKVVIDDDLDYLNDNNSSTSNHQKQNHKRPTSSHATSNSRLTNSLPAWMQNAVEKNDINEEDLLSDQEEEYLDEVNQTLHDDGYIQHESMSGSTRPSNSNFKENYSNVSQSKGHGTGSHVSDDSAKWIQNRSYFLRMNNNANKKDGGKREWARKAKTKGNLTKDATIKALEEELNHFRMAVNDKEEKIENLHEVINQLQEDNVQEEVNRVEAQIDREKTLNTNRQLQIEKTDLLDKFDKFEKASTQRELELMAIIEKEKLKNEEKERAVASLTEELKTTKETAENISKNMVCLEACMLENDYSKMVIEKSRHDEEIINKLQKDLLEADLDDSKMKIKNYNSSHATDSGGLKLLPHSSRKHDRNKKSRYKNYKKYNQSIEEQSETLSSDYTSSPSESSITDSSYTYNSKSSRKQKSNKSERFENREQVKRNGRNLRSELYDERSFGLKIWNSIVKNHGELIKKAIPVLSGMALIGNLGNNTNPVPRNLVKIVGSLTDSVFGKSHILGQAATVGANMDKMSKKKKIKRRTLSANELSVLNRSKDKRNKHKY